MTKHEPIRGAIPQADKDNVEIDARLASLRKALCGKIDPLAAPFPAVTLVFAVSDGAVRAATAQGSGPDLDGAWDAAVAALRKVIARRKLRGRFLRLDWVEKAETWTWGLLRKRLREVKRNYCRRGIALDAGFERIFLEQELNAQAMLYGGNQVVHSVVNEKNFLLAAQQKYGSGTTVAFDDDREVHVLETAGLFCGEDGVVHELYGNGRNAGRRKIEPLDGDTLAEIIRNSSDFLARQVGEDGRFVYGYHPCFDRQIPAYNALRHASTTYSMLEAWEKTRQPELLAAVERALDHLTTQFIQACDDMAFVVDTGNEIKLGANATAILAMSKYTALTGSDRFMAVMEQLACGILHMQAQDGSFTHVLTWPSLEVKEKFRIVYYEGEAAFALMRLYNLTRDERWIDAVERAFGHFIAKDYWKHHDHWLSYCTNELTLYRPDLRYFRFGIQNFEGYLGFVLERITTFPTLLELMMAGRKMLDRLKAMPEGAELLADVDEARFDQALHFRAAYLLNGHFWPEYAMFFRNPNRILGSFFIRHHAFRVRIDDVEHYLSGLVAYADLITSANMKSVRSIEGNPEGLSDTAPKWAGREQISGVCFLSYPAGPKGFTEIETMARKASDFGLSVFYASYRDASVIDGRMRGYIYEKGKWIRGEFQVPTVVDNAPARRKSEQELLNSLAAITYLTCHRIGGKDRTLAILARSEGVKKWLIPSAPLALESLEIRLESAKRVIVKPLRSNRGRGVILLERLKDSTIIARDNETEMRLDKDGVRDFVKSRAGAPWMVQDYVQSVDLSGRAFDIRVPLFRSADLSWEAARIYARQGAGSVTSNLATGGTSHDAEEFLARIYGNKKARILIDSLRAGAIQMAEVMQDSYPFMIDALGFDFGISDGNIHLFEVNAYPGMKGCLDTATDLRVGYFVALNRMAEKSDAGRVFRNRYEAGVSHQAGGSEAGRPGVAFEPEGHLTHTRADKRVLLSEVTGGNWLGNFRPETESMRITAKPVVPGVKSFVIERADGERFGVSHGWIRENKDRVLGVIGSASEARFPELPYLRMQDPQSAFLSIAGYRRDIFNGRVYTVVGSAGKTTTLNMLAHVLRSSETERVFVGTRNKPLDIASQLSWAPLSSQNWIFEVAGANVYRGVTGALASSKVLRPHVCIFTTLAPAHMDEMGSLENAADRKGAAFEGVEKGGAVVINRDMPLAERVMALVPETVRMVTYGRHPSSDWHLEGYDPVSGEICLAVGGDRISYELRSASLHTAMNSIAVLAALDADGREWRRAAQFLAGWQPVKGRGQRLSVPWGDGRIDIIDEAYNANPGSMSSALRLLSETKSVGRRIAVIGHMLELGADERTYHTQLALDSALENIDVVFAVGDMYAEFWDLIPPEKRGAISAELPGVEENLLRFLRPGDCLMVKGSNSTGLHGLVDRLRAGSELS